MDMTSRLSSTLRLLATAALALPGASAMARDQGDIRPMLESAPAISFVYYHAPPLFITTPASVAGAGLMAAATHSEQLPKGAELEKAFAIPDAGAEIAAQLTAVLTTATLAPKLHVEDHAHPRLWNKDPGTYHGETQDPFVLELFVEGKSASYLPLKWRTYYYGISTRLRLIDVAQSKVIWEHHCNQSGLSGDAYKLKVDEFEANGGARLKQVAQAANDFCAHELGGLLAGS